MGARTRDDIRRQAYEMLGITEAQLHLATQITPLLRTTQRTVLSNSPYGNIRLSRNWPHYLGTSDHPVALAVMFQYRKLPKHLTRYCSIEAFCVAAKVEPADVLRILAIAVDFCNTVSSTMIASLSRSRMVQKTIDVGLTDDGFSDRRLFHQATGFLPRPKGTTVNIANVSSSDASKPATVEPPETTIRRLADRFNEARGLPPQAPAAQLIAAPRPAREESTIDLPLDDEEEPEEEDMD